MLSCLLKLREDGLVQEDGGEGGGRPRPGPKEHPSPGISGGEEGPGPTEKEEREAGARSPLCWADAHGCSSLPLPGPQCPLPFNVSEVAGGVILCERASGEATVQRCQLLCRWGYRSAFPPGPLVCSPQRRLWVSQPPQPRACQREWPLECLPSSLLPLRAQGQGLSFSPSQCSVSTVRWGASRAGERAPGSIFFSRCASQTPLWLLWSPPPSGALPSFWALPGCLGLRTVFRRAVL